MSVIKSTTTEAIEMLEASYSGKKIAIKAVGGNVHYKAYDTKDKVDAVVAIREAEATDTATGVSTAAGVTTYTVPNSTLFRLLETVPVFASGVQVGAVVVTAKDATTITVIMGFGSDFTPAIGDVLYRREDEYIEDGDANKFNTQQYRFMAHKATTATDLVVEIIGNGEERKY